MLIYVIESTLPYHLQLPLVDLAGALLGQRSQEYGNHGWLRPQYRLRRRCDVSPSLH